MTRSVGSMLGGRRLAAAVTLLVGAAACYRDSSVSDPPLDPTIDEQLRASFRNWGVVPILATPTQSPAMVELGRSLFFDKVLSGNRDVSCATCHDPFTHAADGLSLAVGTGGVGTGASRVPGSGRRFVPRNAPSMLNQGLGFFYMFWDGRLNEEGGPGRPRTTAIPLPAGLDGLLAAQAMLPVLNRDEMRGKPGDGDVFGNPNELGQLGDSAYTPVWNAAMRRLLDIPEYVAKFSAAYAGTPTTGLGFQHVANAIAAFETHTFTKTGSPFDRYLARDDNALSPEAKRGALLFFVTRACASCHSGPLLGGQNFANVGAPQLGPGVGNAAPLDFGRGGELAQPANSFYKFAFRVPSLRNVELTAPYTHAGAYPTLEAVVRHYSNVDSAMRNYDVSQLPPALRATYHGDAATLKDVQLTLDGRLRQTLNLRPNDQADLVAFLKSLTDPAARNMGAVVPASVPSGLPVRD